MPRAEWKLYAPSSPDVLNGDVGTSHCANHFHACDRGAVEASNWTNVAAVTASPAISAVMPVAASSRQPARRRRAAQRTAAASSTKATNHSTQLVTMPYGWLPK